MVALALATKTHPDQWWETDPATVATAIELLTEQNRNRG